MKTKQSLIPGNTELSLRKIVILVISALGVGFIGGALVFRGGGSAGDATGAGAEAPKEEVWTCSMHPNVRSPKPGLCPICAMDLIPLSSMGAAGGERDFVMSEAAKKLAGITTVPVVRRIPEATVQLYGKVVYDESRREAVSARFDGRIDQLYVNYTGVRVAKGQHLGLIYSPDLLTAQSELLTAIRFGNSDAIRLARDKLELWGFSKKRISEIESTRKVRDQLTIDAPASGIVTHLNISEGDYVKTGTRFFEISDLSQVWLVLEAYESDLPWLRYGQTVEFTVESFPGETFTGTISFIPPSLDKMTRTASIRVNVPNQGERLKPGMFAKGIVRARVAASGRVIDPSLSGKWISPMHPEIVKDEPGQCDVCGMDLVPAAELGYAELGTPGEAPLLVPASAVLHTGKRSVVYIQLPDKEEPTFEGRDILLGPRAENFYLVEAGLKEGEQVVAEGGFVIDSALQIQAKPSMMLPGEPKPLYRQIPVPDEFLTGTDEVLQHYYGIQSALAADSLGPAKKAAAEGMERMHQIKSETLSRDAADHWRNLAAALHKPLMAIGQATEIENARQAFKDLTAVIDEMVRRFGTLHLPVHEMYCPMAFNDTGAAWFQPDKNLLNPYFGASMLRCGTVEDTLSKGGPFSISGEAASAVEGIVKNYLEISRALAADANDKAKTAAETLRTAIATFPSARIEEPAAAFSMWQSLGKTLADVSAKMAGADTIAANRAHFDTLSQALKSLVYHFGGELPFPVNQAHCPMAFNNEGADWLTDSQEILNPYFGSKMLKCGEIVETLHQPGK